MSCMSDFSQPFPGTGRLAENLNLSLDDLLLKTGGTQAIVYSYIVASVENHKGNFIQKGCAPNFQGDLITLCTCKHRMRTFHDMPEWKDKWIAGFTGVRAGDGSNVLVYLMKVGNAFESYCDLWFSKELPDAAKQANLAHKNKFGDIFRPKSKPIDKRDKFDFAHHLSPVFNHVHDDSRNPNGWHKNINYEKGELDRYTLQLRGRMDGMDYMDKVSQISYLSFQKKRRWTPAFAGVTMVSRDDAIEQVTVERGKGERLRLLRPDKSGLAMTGCACSGMIRGGKVRKLTYK